MAQSVEMDNGELDPLAYTLPVAPKMAVESWLPRLQAIGVITVLFAGVQAQLLGGLPTDAGRPSDTALRFFAYGGLLLNLGGTLSGVLLLVAITTVPATARQLYVSCEHSLPRRIFSEQTHTQPAIPESYGLVSDSGLIENTLILRAFGLARGWDTLLLHCLLCFVMGSVFVFVQIVLGAWLAERRLVASLALPFVLFAAVPPLYVFFFSMGPPPCKTCRATAVDATVVV